MISIKLTNRYQSLLKRQRINLMGIRYMLLMLCYREKGREREREISRKWYWALELKSKPETELEPELQPKPKPDEWQNQMDNWTNSFVFISTSIEHREHRTKFKNRQIYSWTLSTLNSALILSVRSLTGQWVRVAIYDIVLRFFAFAIFTAQRFAVYCVYSVHIHGC